MADALKAVRMPFIITIITIVVAMTIIIVIAVIINTMAVTALDIMRKYSLLTGTRSIKYDAAMQLFLDLF